MVKALVPTSLVPWSERPPVPIVPVRAPSRLRSALVVWHFVVLGVALAGLVVRRGDPDRFARRVRETLERLGGLWIKAGQLIALRIDLLPESLCRELSRLQSQALGFPGEVAERIIEEELGLPIDTVFAQWDRTPLAAASIGQVHCATLRESNIRVAVKVQKPFSAELFARDLVVIEWLVWLATALRIYPNMRWKDGLAELRQIMREELDFGFEAEATRRMRKRLRPHRIYVPRVYPCFSSARVLVLEFVDMVLMSDYLRIAREDPLRLAQWRKENRFDPRRVARRLVYSFQRQIMEDNTYHGDLHPGNIGLLRNSRVALIDFGSTNFTEADYLWRFTLLMRTLATGDFAKAADMCLMLCASLPPIDLGLVHSRLVRIMHAWGTRTMVRELPFHDKSMGNLTMLTMQVLLRYRCSMEWAWLRLHRATSTLDASLIELAPGIDYRKITTRAFAKADMRRVRAVMSTVGARRSLSAAVASLQQPEQIQAYAATQLEAVRRQVQAFKGLTDIVGTSLTTLLNLGRLAVLAQAVAVFLTAATAWGAALAARAALLSGGLFGSTVTDPRPLALLVAIDIWLWLAFSRVRHAVVEGTMPLAQHGVA